MDKKKPFSPKGEDILKKEAIAYVNKHLSHLEEEDKEKIIKKMVVDNLKNENFKAGQKKKTDNARKLAKDMEKGKEYYKGLKKSKGTNQDKGSEYTISAEDRAYLHGKMNLSRTQVKLLIKSMKIDETNSWEKAIGGATYKGLNENNNSIIRKMGGSIGASRGGSRGKQTSNDDIANKLMGNLPPGYSDKAPKVN